MNQFEEYKKIYIRLKEDYLKILSDCNYALDASKNSKHPHYKWANEVIEQLDINRCIALRKLQVAIECFFEMNLEPVHAIEKTIGDNEECLKAVLDIYYRTSASDMSCSKILIDIYVFRDIEYYEEVVTDQDIFNDITDAIFAEEFGVVNLRDLETKLSWHVAQKKLEGSKFCPIISGCVELSEKEILESDLDTILEKIYSKIEEYTDGLANSLNKLDEEQKSCTK